MLMPIAIPGSYRKELDGLYSTLRYIPEKELSGLYFMYVKLQMQALCDLKGPESMQKFMLTQALPEGTVKMDTDEIIGCAEIVGMVKKRMPAIGFVNIIDYYQAEAKEAELIGSADRMENAKMQIAKYTDPRTYLKDEYRQKGVPKRDSLEGFHFN